MAAMFLYDGDCGFCSTCARFIERRVPTPAVVIPWQRADLAALGLTREQCETAVWWVEPGYPPAAGPDAIGALLRTSNIYWRPLGWLLRLPLVSWFAWPIYRIIARYRHRLPGGTPACRLN